MKSELEMLLAQAIDTETGEVLDELALEEFEKKEAKLEERVLAEAVLIKELLAEAAKIKEVVKGLQERHNAIVATAEARKQAILATVPVGFKVNDERANLRKQDGREVCIVLDEANLPRDYVEISITPHKTKILADLKRGIEIEGAGLGKGDPFLVLK